MTTDKLSPKTVPVVGIAIALLLTIGGPASARPPTGIMLLDKRESGLAVTGRVRDAEVDNAGVRIDEPLEMGTVTERAAPRIPRPPLHKTGHLNPIQFRTEVSAHFQDMERCRFKVAAVAGLPVDKVMAGEISLHWSVLSSGGTRDTLVFETTPTDLSLMKCIRRRMNAWLFTRPTGGPVAVDYDYVFHKLSSPASP